MRSLTGLSMSRRLKSVTPTTPISLDLEGGIKASRRSWNREGREEGSQFAEELELRDRVIVDGWVVELLGPLEVAGGELLAADALAREGAMGQHSRNSQFSPHAYREHEEDALVQVAHEA